MQDQIEGIFGRVCVCRICTPVDENYAETPTLIASSIENGPETHKRRRLGEKPMKTRYTAELYAIVH